MLRTGRALVALAVAGALSAGLPGAARSQPGWSPDAVPGSLLVTVSSNAALEAIPGAVQLTEHVGLLTVAPGSELREAERARRRPGVVAVEPDRYRRLASVPDDPDYARQWAHEQTRVEGAWARTTGSRTVRVAIIDNGIRGDHPDLRDNIAEQVDVSTGTVIPVGRGVDNDSCELGHATMVAGVVGAVGDNGRDVAGVAWEVSLLDIAASSTRNPESCDRIPDSAVLAGMHYAYNHPAGPVDVINLSLGSQQGFCPEAYDSAVQAARARGTIVVAAAGNLGPWSVSVPAACPGVLAVTATDAAGQIADYATTNPWVALAAPGGAELDDPDDAVISTAREGGTALGAGTSFAAAYVAGTVALLRDRRPDLTPDEVRAVLQHSADEIGEEADPVRHRLRADNAVALARPGRPVPAPRPEPFFPVLRLADPPAGPGPVRVAADEPGSVVRQAAAISRAVFKDHGAVHALLARSDGFADALAGSALGYGIGPLLFTPSEGALAAATAAELERVLPAGGTVYLLGGSRAVPAETEEALVELGYRPVRLEGATREDTAAQTARETVHRVRTLGFSTPSAVVLVTRADWPDAVTAGSLGAVYGIPILLTDRDHLHPATAEALEELQPAQLFVVGGVGSVSAATAGAAAAAGGSTVVRLAGRDRVATGLAVASQLLDATSPRYAVAVNVRRSDGYVPALAATALVAAHQGILVPVEGEDGTVLTPATQEAVRGLGLTALLAGGRDHVSPGAGDLLQRLLDADR